jgi:hypothetical protein
MLQKMKKNAVIENQKYKFWGGGLPDLLSSFLKHLPAGLMEQG